MESQSHMQLGVFLPIGNNGWIVSTTSPQYKPSYELNKTVVQKAERFGFDFALSMIKLRGFGGPSEFWDHNLESFTLMSGLAAVTSRIQLFATIGVLTMPAPLVARMVVTIDSISKGRFGVNIISGWQETEYSQMGIWPGEAHYRRRYEYCEEYITIMKELWTTGHSNFKGEFFTMEDCVLSPLPAKPIQVVCAGQSDRGTRFAAEYADYTDFEAIAWRDGQATNDPTKDPLSVAGRFTETTKAKLPVSHGILIGSFAKVAAMLDELAAVPGVAGAMMTFDDFVLGMENFGTRIQPLMESRRHLPIAA
jgi:pyrimidine oxygenase